MIFTEQVSDIARVESAVVGRAIAWRLRTRREELGLSQENIATRIGTGQSCISKYENDYVEFTLITLCRLSVALETTVSWLITGENQ